MDSIDTVTDTNPLTAPALSATRVAGARILAQQLSTWCSENPERTYVARGHSGDLDFVHVALSESDIHLSRIIALDSVDEELGALIQKLAAEVML